MALSRVVKSRVVASAPRATTAGTRQDDRASSAPPGLRSGPPRSARPGSEPHYAVLTKGVKPEPEADWMADHANQRCRRMCRSNPHPRGPYRDKGNLRRQKQRWPTSIRSGWPGVPGTGFLLKRLLRPARAGQAGCIKPPHGHWTLTPERPPSRPPRARSGSRHVTMFAFGHRRAVGQMSSNERNPSPAQDHRLPPISG